MLNSIREHYGFITEAERTEDFHEDSMVIMHKFLALNSTFVVSQNHQGTLILSAS